VSAPAPTYLNKLVRANAFYARTKHCSHTQAWHRFGIPSTAHFYKQVTAGLYPTTFLVNEWSVEERGANYTVEGWHHVTAEECG
jgi:hypothetical protein